MRVYIYFLLSFTVFIVFGKSVDAQSSNKKNLGFEKGNFNGWVGYEWRHSTATDVSSSFNTLPAQVLLPTSRRHVIISDKSAYDPNTGNALKMIPDGYDYSARLGCEIIGSDASPRCWQQSLRHTMLVDSSNAFLLMKFACVLGLSAVHGHFSKHVRLFSEDRHEKTSGYWRAMNEVPTVLMIAIVILVIVKPFS